MQPSSLIDLLGITLRGEIRFPTVLSPGIAIQRARDHFLAMMEERKPGRMDRGETTIAWHRSYPTGDFNWHGLFNDIPKGSVSFSSTADAVILQYTMRAEASLIVPCCILSLSFAALFDWRVGLGTTFLFAALHVIGAYASLYCLKRLFRRTITPALAD